MLEDRNGKASRISSSMSSMACAFVQLCDLAVLKKLTLRNESLQCLPSKTAIRRRQTRVLCQKGRRGKRTQKQRVHPLQVAAMVNQREARSL